MLVHNLVLSRMDYANCLLFHVADKYIRKLQHVQNLAARIILNVPTFDHVSPALQSLHWLPIKARIEYRILLMVYKIIHGLAPEYLSDLVTIYTPKRSLRSINETKLVVPKSKTVMYGDKSFACAAPKLWNSLPNELREAESVGMFQKHLKTFIFKRKYNV